MNTLYESKNEWSARLVNILAPVVVDGYKSMLTEAVTLCKKNNEMEKYLMTFQNFISRVPKWNGTIIETERKRIIEQTGCNYLEDLITCVHVIQLKVLSAMRVGQKQKKIDIHIPKLDDFIHKVYVNSARKVYKNVYLFEINIPPLSIQKNDRELEKIIQECILITLRESIPIENILKAYMSETVEEIEDEKPLEKEKIFEKPLLEKQLLEKSLEKPLEKSLEKSLEKPLEENTLEKILEESKLAKNTSIRFNDIDVVKNLNNEENQIIVPKTIENLENISNIRNQQRKLEQLEQSQDDEDENIKLTIHDGLVNLQDLEIQDLMEDKIPDLDFETLE